MSMLKSCSSKLQSSKGERLSSKELDEQVSKVSGRSVGLHTYTPLSHENLLRNFSRVASQQGDLYKLRQENERLKTKLHITNEEMRRKEKRIYSLELQLKNTGENRQVTLLNSQSSYRSHTDNQDVSRYETYVYDYDYENSEEILRNHFLEVIRRHRIVLQQKDDEIQSLQEALTRYQGQQKPGQRQPEEEHIRTHDYRSHSSIDEERLRRTEAAVRVFNEDLSLAKTQLQRSPLGEERYVPSSQRDRVVIQELQRRQHFGVIADIEKMGQRFLDKLELEEKLDKLHWQIETARFQAYKERDGKNFNPECTYNKEFEMLVTTRNSMLNALRALRAKARDEAAIKRVEKQEDQRRVHFKENISLNTIQTLYHPSTQNNTSSESAWTKSNQEWPEK